MVVVMMIMMIIVMVMVMVMGDVSFLLLTARLREEHEAQLQRLILKISQEQLERSEVEDRLEIVMVSVEWIKG